MLIPVILLSAAAVITVLLLVKVKIKVSFIKKDGVNCISVKSHAFFGLFNVEAVLPFFDHGEMGSRGVVRIGPKGKALAAGKEKFRIRDLPHYLRNIYEKFKPYRSFIKWLLPFLERKMVVDEFTVEITGGSGDAYYTGILTGIFFSVSGIVETYLANHFRINKRYIRIVPDFSQKTYEFDVYCILEIKTVNIIIMMAKFLFFYLLQKEKKGGDRFGSSYRRTYENSYGKH